MSTYISIRQGAGEDDARLRSPLTPVRACSGQPIQQALTAILEQVEYQVESRCAAVVGIWHVVGLGVMTAEVRHAADFRLSLQRGGQTVQVVQIAVVHADNPVKLQEIVAGHWPRAVGEQVATASSVAAHTGVGQLPLVVTDDAR